MIVILGGGLAGLSAGYSLSEAGQKIVIVERDTEVGGLAKTINFRGFKFDLGGHRFISRNKKIEDLVKTILKDEFLTVRRKSRIYMLRNYFDYPLRPANAVLGLGPLTTVTILSDYCKEKIRNMFYASRIVSLEDWVIKNFGRKMFDLYFKQYSEKVWGIDCKEISEEWVSQRIKGLSLWEAVKNAFFKFSGGEIDTLADTFIYPTHGIGRISDRFRERIEQNNPVMTNTHVIRIRHKDFRIESITVANGGDIDEIEGDEFISSIPLTNLLRALSPEPPYEILKAAARLHYRDLVAVTLLLNRDRITDLTWLYLPEKHIPMGRIHEPKNWSPYMAPQGGTHVVAEYFCFQGDGIWNSTDENLASITVRHLSDFGFIDKDDLIDSCVVRVPKAYPLLDIRYGNHYETILRYLEKFTNLHIAGRGGMFKYHNMDHAMASGLDAAETILKKPILKGEKGYLPIGV